MTELTSTGMSAGGASMNSPRTRTGAIAPGRIMLLRWESAWGQIVTCKLLVVSPVRCVRNYY